MWETLRSCPHLVRSGFVFFFPRSLPTPPFFFLFPQLCTFRTAPWLIPDRWWIGTRLDRARSAQCSAGWREEKRARALADFLAPGAWRHPLSAARVSRRRSGGCYGDKGAAVSCAQSAERSELIPTPRSLSRSGARTPAAICISWVTLNLKNSSSTQSCATTKKKSKQKNVSATFKRNQVILLSSLYSAYCWLYTAVITYEDYLNICSMLLQ